MTASTPTIAEPDQPKRTRSSLSEGILEVFDSEFFRGLAEDVKTLTSKQWVYCPSCRKTVQAEIKDLPRIVKAVAELIEQAEGRPATADGEKAGITLIVERGWGSDGTTDQEHLPAAS